MQLQYLWNKEDMIVNIYLLDQFKTINDDSDVGNIYFVLFFLLIKQKEIILKSLKVNGSRKWFFISSVDLPLGLTWFSPTASSQITVMIALKWQIKKTLILKRLNQWNTNFLISRHFSQPIFSRCKNLCEQRVFPLWRFNITELFHERIMGPNKEKNKCRKEHYWCILCS